MGGGLEEAGDAGLEGRRRGVRSESASLVAPSSSSPASCGPNSPSESEDSEYSGLGRVTRCLHTGQVFLVWVSQGSTHLQW